MVRVLDQLILIHFKAGGLQMGLLQTPLLSGKIIRFIPKSALDDRRKVQRVPFISDVKIDELGSGRAWDMSSHGMYIETLTPYPKGSQLPIRLNLFNETLSINAKVAFSDPGIGIGIEFGRLPIATRFKLEALIHQVPERSRQSTPKDRRKRAERRKRKLPTTAKVVYPQWRSRKIDRRKSQEYKDSPSIELELSEIKVIFFLDRDSNAHLPGLGPPPERKPAILEFRDGEQIQGMLHNDNSESMGLYMDLRVNDEQHYTLFIIKSSIKSIRYLF